MQRQWRTLPLVLSRSLLPTSNHPSTHISMRLRGEVSVGTNGNFSKLCSYADALVLVGKVEAGENNLTYSVCFVAAIENLI